MESRFFSQLNGLGSPSQFISISVEVDTSWSREIVLFEDLCQKSVATFRPAVSPRAVLSELCMAKGMEGGLDTRPQEPSSVQHA